MKTTNTPHIYQIENTDFNEDNSISIPSPLNHSFIDNNTSLIIPSEIHTTTSHTISSFSIDNKPAFLVIHTPIKGITGKKGKTPPQAPQAILNSISITHTKNTPYNDILNSRPNPLSQSFEISAYLTQQDPTIIKQYSSKHLSWSIEDKKKVLPAFFPYSQTATVSFNFINQKKPVAVHTVITDMNTSKPVHSVITEIEYDEETEEKNTESECISENGYYAEKTVNEDNSVTWYVSVKIPDEVIATMKNNTGHEYQWKIRYVTMKTSNVYNWRGWSNSIPVEINTPPGVPTDLVVLKRTV